MISYLLIMSIPIGICSLLSIVVLNEIRSNAPKRKRVRKWAEHVS